MFARFKQLFDDNQNVDGSCTNQERLLMATYMHILGDRYAESVIPGAALPYKAEQKATPHELDPLCSGTYWRTAELVEKAGEFKRKRNDTSASCMNLHHQRYRGPEDPSDHTRYYLCQGCYKKYKRDRSAGLLK